MSSSESAKNDCQQALAVRRLCSDFRELRAEKLVGVFAVPMDDNIFEWHINVKGQSGPLAGYYIHCIMNFTTEYPLKPPKITACSTFGHRNVFHNGYICLSMLEDKYGHAWQSYEKWSSAYSLTSILLQLQSFLLDERNLRYPTSTRLRSFECSRCKHKHESPVPLVLDARDVVSRHHERDDPAYDTATFSPWPTLPQDVSSLILGLLDAVSLHRASWVNREWSDVTERYNLVTRHEMICYHSKASYRDCILGFGMSSIENQRNNPYKLHMDYLSYDAWTSGLRTSVWGEPLVRWIPLVINKNHSKRAEQLLISHLQDVHVEPVTAVGRLMNGLVVSLAKTVTDETMQGSDRLLLSEKTLIGYFALHQILLWLVSKDPTAKRLIQKRVERFTSRDPSNLSKTFVPDMGEYLVYLSCADGVTWDDVSQGVVFELWKRKVLWYTRKNEQFNYPTLANAEEIFKSTRVSRAIVMFQVYFVSVILNGQGDVQSLLEDYSSKLGRPSYKSVAHLGKFCQYISSMQHWDFDTEYQFYWNTVNIETPRMDAFVGFLQNTVQASAQARYHRMPFRRQQRPEDGRRWGGEDGYSGRRGGYSSGGYRRNKYDDERRGYRGGRYGGDDREGDWRRNSRSSSGGYRGAGRRGGQRRDRDRNYGRGGGYGGYRR